MLARAGILVALLAAPSLAFAAYNDVSLTTDTVLSVNGITLNISGSTATIESLTADTASFSMTLQPGSSFEVTAPSLNQLGANTAQNMSSFTCNASASKLGYSLPSSATASATVTITPSTTLCSSTGSGGSAPAVSSPSSSSSTSVTTVATTTTATTTAKVATTAPAVQTTTTTTSASGLSAGQIQSILDVLASFNADASVIANVKASLSGTSTGSVTSAAVHVFKANLTTGSLGSEVKALQQFLNAHGYPVAASGAGSPGNETTRFGAATKAALIKYQKAKGITPAAGYFGPVTRSAMNADK